MAGVGGQGPYRPLWFQLPTRHPRWHQWQTQTGSCSAGNFIKRGLGMKTKAPTGQGTQAQDALRRRHLQVTDSRSLVRTSQATVRPRLPHQLCPGFSWAGRQARAQVPGPASADGRLRRTRDRVSRSVLSPQLSLRPISCRKLHPCRFPECARSPLGSERMQRATLLSPQLHHLCNICLVTSKARFLRKLVVCLAITQGGRINTQPAITGCTAWGPTSAAPAPHLRGSCRAPQRRPGKGHTLVQQAGVGETSPQE